ncbi:PTS sugar transporter subunit IIB [Lacticaseibacillus paracasei]|uniref:PTS sugar transporter subunit IIB n=1 Tax=Lacticaseibacillus paracasei TaxID=1597 RepID=UPI0039A16548
MSYKDNIKLVRVDDRLVHGQIVTKWVNETKANKIVIVNQYLATNEYLSRVFKMAAPSNIDVSVMAPNDFVDMVKSQDLGDNRYIILFKLVDNLKKCFDAGFSVDEVQIGGIGANADRKLVYQSVALSELEAKELLAIQENHVRIFFQRVPDEKPVSLDEIIKKHFNNLA